jgi:hypothetical protein
MNPTLVYEVSSETIRQMPQNYLIAHWDVGQRRWLCDPDIAADKELATRVFLALFDFETRYNRDGLNLSMVTPNKTKNLDISPNQWLIEQFECSYCEKCGGDAEHHEAILLLDNWFARCKYPLDESGKRHPIIKAYRRAVDAL